jgi:putative acetyltransferase
MPNAPRPMPPEEMQAIQDLWVAAWQATMPDVDFAAQRAWLAEHLASLHAAGAQSLRTGPLGAPTGFITWFPADGLVEQLAVHPAAFGGGQAHALLAAAQAARPQGLHLLVNEENPRAIAFYRREGFRVVERTTNPGGSRPVLRMAWP